MNINHTPHRRALAVLLSATALVATPALAQEAAAPAAQTVTPPQVVPTVADTPAQPAASATRTGDATSATPVNAAAAEQAAAEDAERRAERRTARPAAARTTAARPATRASVSPAAAAPAAATATVASTPAPVAATPAPTTPAPDAAAPATPAAATASEATPVATTTETTTTTEGSGVPLWPLALIGLLIVAAGAFFFLRSRRRDDDYVDEAVYVDEPVAQETAQPMTIEPVAAAPVVAAPIAAAPAFLDRTPVVDDRVETIAAPAVPEDATVATADEEDVAALTAAAPVEDRPWLELAMRPVRAGTSDDEAMVEIELTVGNAGAVRADDVRISTFMLENNDGGEMERLLTQPTDAAVAPVSIDPGEGTRVDATLAMLKSGMTGAGFQPIVVADARYRLPNGGEGRTSASFLIGVSADGGTALTPIQTARPQMREDIEAHLYGEAHHA